MRSGHHSAQAPTIAPKPKKKGGGSRKGRLEDADDDEAQEVRPLARPARPVAVRRRRDGSRVAQLTARAFAIASSARDVCEAVQLQEEEGERPWMRVDDVLSFAGAVVYSAPKTHRVEKLRRTHNRTQPQHEGGQAPATLWLAPAPRWDFHIYTGAQVGGRAATALHHRSMHAFHQTLAEFVGRRAVCGVRAYPGHHRLNL
jgi:hypothetical protein